MILLGNLWDEKISKRTDFIVVIVTKIYFILRSFNKTTYQYSSVNCWQSRCFFDKFVAMFGKKNGSFSSKILWRIFLGENSLLAILRLKKVLFPLEGDGG